MIRTLVIVPTYNEALNIVRLIDAILAQDDAAHSFHIVVVDDNSPDGTAALVEGHSALRQRVFLCKRRQKDGRGGAVLHGFQFALERSASYDVVVEMDGDFSHDPASLKPLIAQSAGKRVVIGSRYLAHSKILGWGIGRRVFSAMANHYARWVLRIPIHDYTNGYRCYPLHIIRQLNLSRIRSRGYIVLSEIAYQLFLQGVTFDEVAIIFQNRRRGNSNFSFAEVKEALFAVLALYRDYRVERR